MPGPCSSRTSLVSELELHAHGLHPRNPPECMRFHSHLVRGMRRLGHAVAPLDGVVELFVHGQLWVRGTTCQGTETRAQGSGVWKVARCPPLSGRGRHTGPGRGTHAMLLVLENGLHTEMKMKNREYQGQQGLVCMFACFVCLFVSEIGVSM